MDADIRAEVLLVEESTAVRRRSGDFFPKSKQFTIAGGVFTSNVTNNFPQSPGTPSDFRMIPLGDIDLQREIRLDVGLGVLDRRRERACIRRVYSAKVEGKTSEMTVTTYQGDTAEEEWTQGVSILSSLRHPNIVQLYGMTSTPGVSGIYAAVYHGDLVPFEHFLDIYRHSHFLTLDMWAYFADECKEAFAYFWTVFPDEPICSDCGYWIRASTGRLCMDFIPRETSFHAAVRAGIRWAGTRSNPEGIGAFNAPNRAAMFISSISLEQYDILCHECFGQHRYTLISTPTTVKLGAFIYFPFSSRQTAPVEVASLPPLLDVRNCSWPWINETLDISRYDSKPEANYERGRFVGESNWTRCDARLCLHPSVSFRTIGEHVYPWLSQGNCILSRLQRPSNPKDYAVVQKVVFQLIIFKSSQPIPEGYLFLCPAEQFKVGPSIFAWPDSPAYWSLDPSGADRLTMEDARRLGFPSFEMLTGIKTVSWDESVYAGVHHFQWAKGFDPYSQDAARQLGHPLYQLCTDTNEHVFNGELPGVNEDGEPLLAEVAEEQLDWDTCDRDLGS